MKRSLWYSLVFAVTVTAFTGCMKKDAYEPDRPEQDAQQLYKTNFVAYVGGTINSSVDWGFGAAGKSRSMTRDDYSPTVTLDPKGYSTTFDYKFFKTVQEYFPEGKVCKLDKWYNYEFQENGSFFDVRIIYCHTTYNDVIGFYYYDPATQSFKDHVKVPLYQIVQGNNSDLGEHLQFNTSEIGGDWYPVYYNDGYSIWTEGTTAKRLQTRMYTIDLKANYRFGFYVENKDLGKTFYTNKYLNADTTAYSGAAVGDEPVGEILQSYVFGLTDNDTADCNMLFDIPQIGDGGKYPTLVKPENSKPQPELKWYRIIAEDLNAHDLDKDGEVDDTDFDFNDIVLDVALTDTGAKCTLQAAGATLKIRIDGNDNLEVHKMFGVDQKVMVNTHAEKKGLAHADKDSVEFELAGSYKSIDDIKIEVFRQNRWMTLHAPKGDAASKIAVGIDFEWPDERQSLKEKYPDFPKYVRDGTDIDSWWKKW